MYLLYNLLLWILSPALLGWAVWRNRRGRLDGLRARCGFFSEHLSPDAAPVVWLHAVSLGEMKVAGALADQLRARVPGIRFVLTASTRTGYAEARRNAGAADVVLYPPADYRWVCRLFLRRLRPDLLVVLETELWPNLFREAKRFGAGLVVANARISDRSLPRYRATRSFWKAVLGQVDAVYAQSPRDAERFALLGAPENRVQMAGNLKYTMPLPTTPLAATLAQALRDAKAGPVLVAGSTMPGEEAILLDTFLHLRRDFPALWMILAPRHPERSAAVAAEARAQGVPLQLRSAWTPGEAIVPGIFLLDTTGELASLYPLATAAFIGGTLVPTGGHNILEPAQAGCPIVIGPSMENFAEIAGRFLQANALIQVRDSSDLISSFRSLLTRPDHGKELGRAARELLERQESGMEVLLKAIQQRLSGRAEIRSVESPVAQASAAESTVKGSQL
jgi:3-deoxy-D-manno-octulosonic-acid transferase